MHLDLMAATWVGIASNFSGIAGQSSPEQQYRVGSRSQSDARPTGWQNSQLTLWECADGYWPGRDLRCWLAEPRRLANQSPSRFLFPGSAQRIRCGRPAAGWSRISYQYVDAEWRGAPVTQISLPISVGRPPAAATSQWLRPPAHQAVAALSGITILDDQKVKSVHHVMVRVSLAPEQIRCSRQPDVGVSGLIGKPVRQPDQVLPIATYDSEEVSKLAINWRPSRQRQAGSFSAHVGKPIPPYGGVGRAVPYWAGEPGCRMQRKSAPTIAETTTTLSMRSARSQ